MLMAKNIINKTMYKREVCSIHTHPLDPQAHASRYSSNPVKTGFVTKRSCVFTVESIMIVSLVHMNGVCLCNWTVVESELCVM